MLVNLLLVGSGGFLGAIGRFLLIKYFNPLLSFLPLGIVIANVLGSFAAGFIFFYALSVKPISKESMLFISIGFLGSFTTMSSFALDTMKLWQDGSYMAAATNIVLNLLLSLFAIIAGKELALVLAK